MRKYLDCIQSQHANVLLIQSGAPGNCWKHIPQMYPRDTEIEVFGIGDFDPARPYFEIEINYLIGRQNGVAGV
jgi:hypothetical protein